MYMLAKVQFFMDFSVVYSELSCIFAAMKRMVLSLCLTLCVYTLFLSGYAQRIEARFNKEFGAENVLKKSLGGGGSFIMDMWCDHLDIQINFDYSGYNKKEIDYQGHSTKFDKYKAGVSALYTRPIGQYLYFRIGGDVAYNNVSKVVTDHSDESQNKGLHTTGYDAHLLGIGAILQLQVRLGKLFRLGAGVLPAYLIPLKTSVDRPNVQKQYTKGFFDFHLQIGLEIKLNNINTEYGTH